MSKKTFNYEKNEFKIPMEKLSMQNFENQPSVFVHYAYIGHVVM
jgi:hypothetical protein